MQKVKTIILLIVLAVSMYCAPITVENVYSPVVVEASTLEEDMSFENNDWLSIYSSSEDMITTYHIMNQYSEKEQKDINFYTAFFENEILFSREISTIYMDCSYSMDKTFGDEKEKIMQNLNQFISKNEIVVEEVFKNAETHLYSLLDSIAEKNSNDWFQKKSDIFSHVIVTDLCDTGDATIDEALKSPTFSNFVIFCVPYESTNKKAVLHCETFANEVLDRGLWVQSSVFIVYTDEVVVEYHNKDWQFGPGGINIYLP